MSGGREPAGGLSLVFLVTTPLTARHLARGQLAHLRRRGFEVTVVASPGPALDDVARHEGVSALAVPMAREIAPLADLMALWRLYRVIRRRRPRLVSAGTPKAGLLGMVAARLAGVPARLYTMRGLRLESERGWRRRLFTATEKLAAACATRVVCVSPSLERLYVGLGLAPAAKVAVLANGSSNGVDLERFHPRREAQDAAARLRRELGIAPDAPVLGFVGRFTRDKGIADLVRAFDRVAASRPPARLLLVGRFEAGDPLPPEIHRRLEQDPRILLHPFAEDTAPLYRVMDLVVFASRREGLPNVPLEAAASELPVAAYVATGTVDAVEDGVTGTLVPSGDWQALAEACLRYLDDPELAARHGRAGRERAARLFRRELVWQAWESEYRRLASEAAR